MPPVWRGRVGQRVVVRRRLPDGSATDVVGELLAVERGPAGWVLSVRHGDDPAEVPLADVIAGKVVPPRPARAAPPHRALAVADLERVMALHWRAPVAEPLGTWLLRSAEGFTNRANSVLAAGLPGATWARPSRGGGRGTPRAVAPRWRRSRAVRRGPGRRRARRRRRGLRRGRLGGDPRPRRLRPHGGDGRARGSARRSPAGSAGPARPARRHAGRRLARAVPLPRGAAAADRDDPAGLGARADVRVGARRRPHRGRGPGLAGRRMGRGHRGRGGCRVPPARARPARARPGGRVGGQAGAPARRTCRWPTRTRWRGGSTSPPGSPTTTGTTTWRTTDRLRPPA